MMNKMDLHIGTPVCTADGESLGSVIEVKDDYFVVERGLIFLEDYAIDYDGIRNFDGTTLYVQYSLDEVKHGYSHGGVTQTKNTSAFSDPNLRDNSLNTRDDNIVGRNNNIEPANNPLFERTPSSPNIAAQNVDMKNTAAQNISEQNMNIEGQKEVRIPLREEELDVKKSVVDSGRVRIRKEIVTEFRQINVPVEREELVVEHVPVQTRDSSAGEISDSDFESRDIEVPLREERFDINKKTVVKEEVVLKKKKVEETVNQEASLRKEKIVVDRDDMKNKDETTQSTPLRDLGRPTDKAS